MSLPAIATAQNEAAVQRLMLQASSLVEEGKLAEAIAEYRRVADAVPDRPLAASALIEASRLHLQIGEPQAAVELAERILASHPRQREAAAAAVLRAEVQASQASDRAALETVAADLEAALVRFGRQEYPNLTARSAALNLIARLRLELGEPGEAMAPLVEVLEDEADSTLTPRAQLLYARALLQLDRHQAAFQALREAARSTNSAEAEEARTLLSLLHRMVLRPEMGVAPWLTSRPLVGPADGPPGGFKRPRALAASTLGRLAVIDSANAAYVIGDDVGTFPQYKSVSSVGFEGQTPLFVGPEDVQMGTSRMTFVQGGSKPKELDRIEAAARDRFGNWVLIDRSLDGVGRFDADRRWQEEIPVGGEAVDLARDDQGRIYVLAEKPTRILILSNELDPIASLSPPIERPVALDVDPLGNLYVLDEQGKTVSVLDPTGKSIVTLGPVLPTGVELRSPEDLAVDGSGRIYIADSRLGAVYVLE